MEQLREAAGTPSEDPQLRQMLATHVHCGEVMRLVAAEPPAAEPPAAGQSTAGQSTAGQPPAGPPSGRNDGGLLTYRCACGFSFDDRQE